MASRLMVSGAWLRRWALAVLLLLPCGVARAAGDPWEGFNRAMFAFNGKAIDYAIEPTAAFLETWIPAGVRKVGARVYDNMTEPEFIVTNLFHGYKADAGVSAGRFLINSTVGLAGMFDPATEMGLVRRETEFGAALCAAGVPAGPYVVLPLIGPTNAMSAGLITGFFAVEWYALSLISSVLATADLVVDISASAASLRHAAEEPDKANADPYVLQRSEYLAYLDKGCSAAGKPVTAASAGLSGR